MKLTFASILIEGAEALPLVASPRSSAGARRIVGRRSSNRERLAIGRNYPIASEALQFSISYERSQTIG
ncbi:hypothetical protein [Chelatococcus reniformis]|uniref:hypothetical protein n=1 Tax=Chelatococcus reniformis TaxID=1494448 RepID=UPI0016632188|nr:hypothetical protein [Chelatococcus reniformis]